MKKVLFICDYIPPEHSATGRFTYYIAEELCKVCEVHLVCLSSKYDIEEGAGFHVHRVPSRYGCYQKMIKDNTKKQGVSKFVGKIIYRIYYLISCKRGIDDVKSHRKNLQKQCKKIIEENGIDTIISVSNPFENHAIAYELVKKEPQLRWFPYLMDSNRNNAVYVGKQEIELKYFDYAEKVLIVPALLHDKKFLEDFSTKIEVLDMPIVPVQIEPIVKTTDENMTFVYAGKFYEEIRNPSHLFEIFEMLPRNYILKIFYGGCNDVVQEYKEKLGDRLQVSGYISPEELDKVIAEANVVISLGNTVVNQVPSKIYDLIAYGKPILNFYQREDDISIGHLAPYPLCKNISYMGANIEEIRMWCEKNKNNHLTYEDATSNMKEKCLENCTKRLCDIIGDDL